ncbi:hypothetical protein KXD40_006206 [Peronospora effusa]|nr:hypothetical protein KXD40_006206 [Peronospora effusa]
MRTYPLLLVAATSLSAYADTSSTRSSSTLERPALSHQHAPQRMLRDGAETAEEERTLTFLKTIGDSITTKVAETRLNSFIDGYKKTHPKESGVADVDLLNNQKLLKIVNEVRKRHKDIEPEKVIAKSLAEHYTDDAFVAMLRTTPEHLSEQKQLATNLQDGWIKSTVEIAGKPNNGVTKNVLKLIDLDDNNVLSSPRFKAYFELMKREHATNSDDLYSAMAKDLASHYGKDDAAFLKMLKKFTTKDSATQEIATKLEGGWITFKVEEAGKPIHEAGVPINEAINHVLKLINVDDNMLSSPPFQAYFKLMEKKHGTNADGLYIAMAIDLGYRYGSNDAAFLEMLEKSTKDLATKRIATKLVKGWKTSKGEDTEVPIMNVISSVLKFINPDDNVLSSPLFEAYVKLMEREYGTNADGLYSAMAKDLVYRFDKNDAAVLKMLKKSTKDLATKELATRLENDWVSYKVQEVGVLFDEGINHVLKLINVDDNVLSSPPFKAYFKLMEEKHGTNADDLYLAMAIDLGYRYGINDFLKMLEKSTKDLATKELATKLVKEWKTSKGEETKIEKVIKRLLKLIHFDDNVLSSPPFKAYFKLMKRKHATNSDGLYSAMAKDLASHYGKDDAAFLKMLKKFTTMDIATQEFATKLEGGWITSTVEEAGKPTDEVINYVLKLINLDDNELSSPPFQAYFKLMKKKHDTNADDLYLVMVKDLVHHYDNNDAAVLKMLETFTKDPATKEIATKLQDRWIISTVEEAGKPTDEVIKDVLNLINIDGNVLSSPRFKAYFELMKRKHGTKDLYIAMARDLWNRYDQNDAAFLELLLKKSTKDSNLAALLLDGFAQIGIDMKLTPSIMFDRLIVDKHDVNMLSSPHFELWFGYVTARCNRLNRPDERWVSMASVLVKNYQMSEISAMVQLAQTEPKTKDIANGIMNYVEKYFSDLSKRR